MYHTMNKKDFNFELPASLIAQYPLPNRSDSRLLSYNRQTGKHSHHGFSSLVDFLEAGDLLVMNNTKVIPARLYGHKKTGGKVELLLERMDGEHSFWAHIKASKALKPGGLIQLDKGFHLEITERDGDLFHATVHGGTVPMLLEEVGHIPLPPYITRADERLDLNRYQTIYAIHDGSVAAPTAGLHFDETIFARLQEKGIGIAYTTLHVGAGTFQPVRCERILDHKMHSEYFTISEALATAVNQTRANGKRVIAVGTTSLRSLESGVVNGELKPCSRYTDIFIYPGYTFQLCDGLVTNFHLPESTLLMLVAAFIGHEPVMTLYQDAIKARYRFFSYGDACLFL